jgi:hypothetical protein
MMKLRGDPRRAQFPMGDYAYLMESFGEILGIDRFEPAESGAGSSVRGSHFQCSNSISNFFAYWTQLGISKADIV